MGTQYPLAPKSIGLHAPHGSQKPYYVETARPQSIRAGAALWHLSLPLGVSTKTTANPHLRVPIMSILCGRLFIPLGRQTRPTHTTKIIRCFRRQSKYRSFTILASFSNVYVEFPPFGPKAISGASVAMTRKAYAYASSGAEINASNSLFPEWTTHSDGLTLCVNAILPGKENYDALPEMSQEFGDGSVRRGG